MTYSSCGRCVRAVLVLLAVLASASAVPHAQAPTPFEQAWQSGTPITVTGVVSAIVADDFANKRSELVHMIRDERTGRSYQLRFENAALRDLRSGSIVRVAGRARGSEIYVLADQTSLTSSTTASAPTIAQTTPLVTGDQKTIVMVANFRDASVSCSLDSINNTMFAAPNGLSVDGLYRWSSLGQVSFSGNVVGPYTLNNVASTDICNISAWADATDVAAAASGVDLTAYARKVYVMPGANACPGAGFGSVGGAPSGAWILACNVVGVFAHELGHNLGMDHASTPTSEYGDTTDPMAFGSSWFSGVNAPHRHQLGWLGVTGAQLVNQDGFYDVAALAIDPADATASRTLVIAKPDTSEYYYVSYRAPLAYDNYIDGSYYHRLSVHRYKGDGSASRTFLVSGLADGESFVDAANGITVTQVSHNSAHATARIEFAATPCVRAAPSISLSPQAQSGAPGAIASYAVSVTNHDASTCAASTFVLSSAVASGLAGTISPASLNLAPGMSGPATLTTTSSVDTPATTYNVSVSTSDSATTIHSASSAGSYTVIAPCIPAAPSISLSPQAQSGAPGASASYAVSVTNRDTSTCAASTFALSSAVASGLTGAMSPASLTLAPGMSGQATLTTTSSVNAPAMTYNVSANASDSATMVHSASSAGTYTVIAPCVPGVPAMSASPVSQVGAPGAVLIYAVSVTNHDGPACSPSTLVVQPVVSAGWSGSVSTSALTLGAGQSSAVTLSVMSPSGSAQGNYDARMHVSDGPLGVHDTWAGVTYTVQFPVDAAAPSSPTALTAAASAKAKQIALAWGAAIDNVGVVGYRVHRNGVVVATATGTSWNDPLYVGGARYTYYVVAYDAAGNVSLPSGSVTVTISGGGKK